MSTPDIGGTPPGRKPIRGNNPTSLAEARNEMRRLMGIQMALNKKYLERERYVTFQHGKGHPNFTGDLMTVLNNDLLLSNISGGAKTVSTLIQGISGYILAELALKAYAKESTRDVSTG